MKTPAQALVHLFSLAALVCLALSFVAGLLFGEGPALVLLAACVLTALTAMSLDTAQAKRQTIRGRNC